MPASALQTEQLPGVRWAILRTIGVGGHLGATETMCRDVVVTEYLGGHPARHPHPAPLPGEPEARRDRPVGDRSLARHGHDVVEYQVDVAPGIRRPRRLDN